MQISKDSFLNHLATKLAEADSSRVITIDGVTRPAVMACENERAELAEALENCYCVDWGEATGGDRRAAKTLGCAISYWTAGSAEMSGVDRGRALTEMDELMRLLLADGKTAKIDLGASPPVEVGGNVFWGAPKFGVAEQSGMKLKRTVTLDVHYFAEADR